MRELINKEEAIQSIKELLSLGDCYCNESSIVGRLNSLPSVKIDQNQGEWVPQYGGGYRCSKCGSYALDMVDGNFIHVAERSKFCPNCGTYMINRNEY